MPVRPADPQHLNVHLDEADGLRQNCTDLQLRQPTLRSWQYQLRSVVRRRFPPFCAKLEDRGGCTWREACDIETKHVGNAAFDVL